ncbi:hypothetical protein EV44_g4192 [Erysiphe necator]|uniref:Uncharacterized protein n=1 Tax=Uncinula necator TaxID=52586 RepID=A0A0B1NY95_UNCNE|nr:hypothetical protein EV44_g4192 [Erysiphe necator]
MSYEFNPPSLYDPASPNPNTPNHIPIVNTGRSPPSQQLNPKFLDLDDPDPDGSLTQDTISCDDYPPSGPIEQALRTSKEAAKQRALEAEIIFGPISKMLYQHCSSTTQMPPKLAHALREFRDDLTKLAARHFEAYLSGIPTSTNQTLEKPSQLNYVQAAKSRPSVTAKVPPSNKYSIKDKKAQIIADERLFLRLSEDSPLRTYSGYAL